MTDKTDRTDELSVYAAGMMCSGGVWVFPLIRLASELDCPHWLQLWAYLGALMFLSAGSWAGVGIGIGVILASLLQLAETVG